MWHGLNTSHYNTSKCGVQCQILLGITIEISALQQLCACSKCQKMVEIQYLVYLLYVCQKTRKQKVGNTTKILTACSGKSSQLIFVRVVWRRNKLGRVRFNVPPNTLSVISGTGFYGSNDPTNSVKACVWKTDRQTDRRTDFTIATVALSFNPTMSSRMCYNDTTHMQYDKINTQKKHKHKWIYAQWNGPSVTKPNPENCKNCSSNKTSRMIWTLLSELNDIWFWFDFLISVLMTVHNFSMQYSTEQF